ncbi:hypothetical protein Tel_04595 [Candidatus Tenderia electrophaga]|uniref:DUF3887 domain-containing protein n=1 Tax=Candidatus Tenderia electrophaga TaxID=1748243 RepID=A0A0S2TBL5_9GAMM|nr:hypothetical protein Tel_04595 [Candidatus Tenderia electrophaga]
MNPGRWLVLGLLGILLLGCSDFPSDERAMQLGNRFYQAMARGDLDRALSLFSSEQPPGKWDARLKQIQAQLGAPLAYQLTHYVTNSPYRGRFYTLDFSVRYDHDRVAAETLTLYNNGDDDRLDIVSYAVIAPGVK